VLEPRDNLPLEELIVPEGQFFAQGVGEKPQRELRRPAAAVAPLGPRGRVILQVVSQIQLPAIDRDAAAVAGADAFVDAHGRIVPRPAPPGKPLAPGAAAYDALVGVPEQATVAERFADGRASEAELETAREAATREINRARPIDRWELSTIATAAATLEDAFLAAARASMCTAIPHPSERPPWWMCSREQIHTEKLYRPLISFKNTVVGLSVIFFPGTYPLKAVREADLLREIVGNPYRPVAINPHWLAWNGGTVAQLARGIYAERAFDRMPVLGDALEEAGCCDERLLEHCRRPGGHLRGCWAVDLLSGRE
jgi:hypothetical protein